MEGVRLREGPTRPSLRLQENPLACLDGFVGRGRTHAWGAIAPAQIAENNRPTTTAVTRRKQRGYRDRVRERTQPISPLYRPTPIPIESYMAFLVSEAHVSVCLRHHELEVMDTPRLPGEWARTESYDPSDIARMVQLGYLEGNAHSHRLTAAGYFKFGTDNLAARLREARETRKALGVVGGEDDGAS